MGERRLNESKARFPDPSQESGRTEATSTFNDSAFGSYPDHPHSGTTAKSGGAKSASTRRKEKEIPMRIVRIDTIPMTDDELHKAAEALAVLLNRYWREHDLAA